MVPTVLFFYLINITESIIFLKIQSSWVSYILAKKPGLQPMKWWVLLFVWGIANSIEIGMNGEEESMRTTFEKDILVYVVDWYSKSYHLQKEWCIGV